MTTARPKEGPRAPLFYLLSLFFPGWVSLAAAQTVELSDLEVCAGLETPELKLACFEAIVATGRRAVTAAAVLEPETTPDPVVVSVAADALAESAPEPGASTPEPVPAASETVAESPEDPAPVVSQIPAASPEDPVEATRPEPAGVTADVDSFGSEHLRQENPDDPAVMNARVVEVSKTGRGALVFHLDNGQVWRQIEPRYYPYPRSREFDVEISTGMLGEYRLQVEGAGRRVTIRRVK